MSNLAFWLSRKIDYPLVPPEVIQISLTYRCNLRCRMCSIAELLPQEEELYTDQIYKIIDDAAFFGIKELILTGGEPFLREDIFGICDYSHSRGLRNIVTTNGLLIDARMSQRIADSNLDHVHFSLDGLEETNGYYRGKLAFAKTVSAIKLLNGKRKEGRDFSLGIAVTVMDQNVPQLHGIAQLADELGVDVVNFQPLISDNANFMERELPRNWVTAEKIPVLRGQIEKIEKSAWKHITVLKEPRLGLLSKYYEGALKKSDWVCFGGFKTVFICFSKNEPLVYTCHGICGNLKTMSLKEAWLSKEARGLRKHSKRCEKLCLQSCYSREASSTLGDVFRASGRKNGNG